MAGQSQAAGPQARARVCRLHHQCPHGRRNLPFQRQRAPNTGIIPNLPADVCVEVPVFADRQGFHPVFVGALPPQLAALNNVSIAVEEMAVAAAVTGNPRKVFHAIAYDPLSAAVLSLAEIKRMVQTMLNKNKAYLPQFKRLSIDS